jgi:beta-phosphoglucomutase-like phosphatase (HAD superfamily)
MIRHILFGLNGVLVDPLRLRDVLATGYGVSLSRRLGGTARDWEQAYRQVAADWDSYHADLDFTEDGLDAYWEGQLRVLRAIFRAKGAVEPPIHDLKLLTRDLLYETACAGDASYAEVLPILKRLAAQGYTLGVISLNLTARTQGILAGAGLTGCIQGAVVGPDITERFALDAACYQAGGAAAETCLVVESSAVAAENARAAGLQAVVLERVPQSPHRSLSVTYLQRDLGALLPYLDQAVRVTN